MENYTSAEKHYDLLIDENNDPVHDPLPLKLYMDNWDGEPFLAELRLSPEKSVLEIGVGAGRIAVRVLDKCGKFTGIDLSGKTIEKARANLGSSPSLIYGDYLTFQFAETFDVIYSSLTFMHIQNKRAAIQKTAELLKHGGRFVLSLDKNTQSSIDYGERKVQIWADDPKEISTLLSEAGFTIERQFETELATIISAVK